MSSYSHTPGPWYADGGFVGTEIGFHNIVSGVGLVGEASEEQVIANAHLIAAAPDLYSALFQVVNQQETDGRVDGIRIAIAKAALEKARGES